MTQGIRVNDLVHHGHVQVPQSVVLPETVVPFTLERKNVTKVLGSMTLSTTVTSRYLSLWFSLNTGIYVYFTEREHDTRY
jgi:hypothetical protein